MQVTLGGKVAVGGTAVVAAIAVLFTMTPGATYIDYWLDSRMGTQGDSMTPTCGPSSEGSTVYNDGSGDITIPCQLVTTLADSSQSPPFNDSNTQLIRLIKLDFNTPVNTEFVFLNGLVGYGGSSAKNVPAGWWGMDTSGSMYTDASFHVLGGVSIQGRKIFTQQRNAAMGDVGIIFSPANDSSPYAHFINAYHAYKDTVSTQGCASNVITLTLGTAHDLTAGDDVWIDGTNTNTGVFTLASATHSPEVVTYPATCTNVSPVSSSGYVSLAKTNGDPVECNAPMLGSACTYAGYTAGMMWRGSESLTMQNLKPVVYGQDGGGTGPDGSSTYDYWIGYNGYQYLHRILRTNSVGIGIKNPSNWTHYMCAGPIPSTACDMTDNANWDALSANATPITGAAISTGQNEGPIVYKAGTYYMLLNLYQAGGFAYDAIGLNTAPHANGPWTLRSNFPVPGGNYQALGFPVLMFPMILTQSSTQFTIPMMADNNITGTGHPAAGSPMFNLLTIHHP